MRLVIQGSRFYHRNVFYFSILKFDRPVAEYTEVVY